MKGRGCDHKYNTTMDYEYRHTQAALYVYTGESADKTVIFGNERINPLQYTMNRTNNGFT